LTGYALNVAIGLQVLFGALTTGLAVVVSGHRVGLSISRLRLRNSNKSTGSSIDGCPRWVCLPVSGTSTFFNTSFFLY